MNPITPSAPPRPTRVRWLIFGLACATSWLLYLHRYAWGAIKPDYARANPSLKPTDLGWLDASFMAAYGIGQIPGGLIGDRLGPRLVLTAIILLWSLMVAGLGWVRGFWLTFAVLALFGLFQAGTYPLLSKVTRSWFPPAYRTSVQGAVTALGRIGGACAPLVLVTLLMGILGLPWYTVLFAIAVPGIALATGIWIVFRNSPGEHPWTNELEREEIGRGQPAPAAGASRLKLDRARLTTLSAILLYAFASTMADMLYVFWIPLFLNQEKCLEQRTLGMFAPLPLIGGALGGIVGGMLNDVLIRRTGQRRWVRTGVGFTGKIMAANLILVSLAVTDGRLAMVVLLAVKFFGDWSLPTQWGTITDIGGKSAATIFALVNSVGAVGGFLAGPLMGFALREYGWHGLFVGVAFVYLFAALCWLFIDCTQQLSE